MNEKEKTDQYRIATRAQTELFGGMNPVISKMMENTWTNATMKKEAEGAMAPLVISGTITKLGNAARELMLDLCPELKVIFQVSQTEECTVHYVQ